MSSMQSSPYQILKFSGDQVSCSEDVSLSEKNRRLSHELFESLNVLTAIKEELLIYDILPRFDLYYSMSSESPVIFYAFIESLSVDHQVLNYPWQDLLSITSFGDEKFPTREVFQEKKEAVLSSTKCVLVFENFSWHRSHLDLLAKDLGISDPCYWQDQLDTVSKELKEFYTSLKKE